MEDNSPIATSPASTTATWLATGDDPCAVATGERPAEDHRNGLMVSVAGRPPATTGTPSTGPAGSDHRPRVSPPCETRRGRPLNPGLERGLARRSRSVAASRRGTATWSAVPGYSARPRIPGGRMGAPTDRPGWSVSSLRNWARGISRDAKAKKTGQQRTPRPPTTGSCAWLGWTRSRHSARQSPHSARR